jgi:hypothetical protein
MLPATVFAPWIGVIFAVLPRISDYEATTASYIRIIGNYLIVSAVLLVVIVVIVLVSVIALNFDLRVLVTFFFRMVGWFLAPFA